MFRISRAVCAVAVLWTGAALANPEIIKLDELGNGVYGVRLDGYTQVTAFPFKDRGSEARVLADYFVLNKPVSQATKQRIGESTRDNLVVLSMYREQPSQYFDTLWSRGMSVDFFVTKEGALYQMYPALTESVRDSLTISENDKKRHLLPQGSTFNDYMSQSAGLKNASHIAVAVEGESWLEMTEQQRTCFPKIQQLVRELNRNQGFEFQEALSLFASKEGTAQQCGFSKAHLIILPEAQTLFPGASRTEVKQPNMDVMIKSATNNALSELAGYLENKTSPEAVRWKEGAEAELKKRNA